MTWFTHLVVAQLPLVFWSSRKQPQPAWMHVWLYPSLVLRWSPVKRLTMPHTGPDRLARFSGVLDLVLYAGLVFQGPWSSAAPPPALPAIIELKVMHRQMKASDLSRARTCGVVGLSSKSPVLLIR